jgi:putative DNA primase/helicase
MALNDTLEQFRQAIEATGLQAPDVIHDDGAIHRFSPGGRRGDTSAWYVLHADGIAAGSCGRWKTGLQFTWCAKSDNAMTSAERNAHKQRIKAMKAQRDEKWPRLFEQLSPIYK